MLFKKTILLFIIFTILFQGVGMAFVFKKTQAIFPISVSAFAPVAMAQKIFAERSLEIFLRKVVETLIEIAKEYLRIRLLDYLVGQTVAWINNGFRGGPYFVTNFKDFLLEAGVNAVGDYLAQSKYKQICSPFDYSIRLNLGGFQQMPSTTCTLDWVVRDIERYWGDRGFFEGGLAAFGESLKMQNNIYGAYYITEKELELEALRKITLREADVQNGFKNTERCVQTYTDIETGVRTCLKWQITTPGGIIAGKLQKALNVDIDKILSADEFTTYAAAIIDALINQLIKAGMNGLFGLAGGGGSADPGNIPDLPPLLYVCNKTAFVCRPVFKDDDGLIGVRDTYDTADECNEKCVDDTDPDEGGKKTYNDNLLACEKGIFVRARPPSGCVDGICNRCTGIGGVYASDSCFVFCKHTKDAEWKSGANNGKQFSEEEVNSVANFFGLSSPAGGCFCQTEIGDYPFYDYDGVGHFKSSCLECNDETLFGARLCRSTTWCKYQLNQSPSPSPSPTESPSPSPPAF